MMTEFCAARLNASGMKINCYLGYSAPKIKEAEQKEKMPLYSGYFQVEKTSPYTLSLSA